MRLRRGQMGTQCAVVALLTCVSLDACVVASAASTPLPRYNLTATRAKLSTVIFGDAQLDLMYLGASAILQENDDGQVCTAGNSSGSIINDQSGCVKFARSGSIGEFGASDPAIGYITNETQLTAVFNITGYDIKLIIAMQNCCGVTGPVDGCTKTLGTRNSVIRMGSTANLWAHEMGHVAGMGENNACDAYVMYPTVTTAAVALLPSELTKFQEGGDAAVNPGDCGTPVGTSFMAQGADSSVVLSWADHFGQGTPYIVRRADTCVGPFEDVVQVVPGDPAYTVDGVNYQYVDTATKYLRRYHYAITASDGTKYTDTTPVSGRNVLSSGLPPAGLSGLGYFTTAGIPRIVLDWGPPNGAPPASYYVYRTYVGSPGECSNNLVSVFPATGTHWEDDQVIGDGRAVSYQVRAKYTDQVSPATSELKIERRPVTLQVTTGTPDASISVDSVPLTVPATGVALACTTFALSGTKSISVTPAQDVSASHWCYESWSNGASRSHVITLRGDSTVALNLVPSGSGPTDVSAGANMANELTDCRGPYKFLGEAYAPQGLTIYPGTKLRFPKAGGGAPYAGLSVSKYLVATGVTFETADSTESNVPSGAWKGIQLTDANFTQLALTRCTIRNATSGVSTDAVGRISVAQMDSCNFEENTFDVGVTFRNAATPVKSLVLRGNYFRAKNAVLITGVQSSGYAPVAATIEGNTFAGAANQSRWLRLQGGFTGGINSNTFNMGNTGNVGVELHTIVQYPNVSLSGNYFQFGSTARTALIAPDVAGHPYILAYNNSWNLSSASEIEESILHFDDTMNNNPPKAEVVYEPFTPPPGGGGGGGGGGCPFVLSMQSDGSYALENSILGASEARQSSGAFVRDAYPLEHARIAESGNIHLRIAELEHETDFFDRVGLEAVLLPVGAQVGVDPSGGIVAFRPARESATVVGWSGRNTPFVSPIAPGNAYTGEPGDSLELLVPAIGPIGAPISRRFYISMIPKPPQAPGIPSTRVGVVVRIASDETGSRWVTSQTLVPRALWSNAILPVELPASGAAQRIRIVWNTRHALGWVGVAEVVEPTARIRLPLRSAAHSVRGAVIGAIAEEDGESTRLEPGEYVDLVFDGGAVPEGARLVLTASGRYQLGGAVGASAPAAAYADQNRPNPFNPRTEIQFGLPRPEHVRITVFDVTGRRVRTLLERELPAGHHVVSWDGTDVLGRSAASGVYFYQINAGDFISRKRMVLVR